MAFCRHFGFKHVRRKTARCSSEVPTRHSVSELLRGGQRKAGVGSAKNSGEIAGVHDRPRQVKLNFSGAGAVPGFYGKPDAVYGLRTEETWFLWEARCSLRISSVCGCLRMSADGFASSRGMFADVCGQGQSA